MKRRRPELARRRRDDLQRRELDLPFVAAGVERVHERPPHRLRLAARQALEHHRDAQDVAGAKADLLAPVRVDQVLGAEVDDQADELAERRRRRGLDRHVHRAEVFRQRMHAQGDARHDAEAAAAAALQRPEEIGVAAGIGDPHLAVGGDDFGFEQARRREAVLLREAAEAAALDQAGDADGHAAAALHVAARLGRDRVVDVRPDRAGADRDRAHRRGARRAALRDEGVVERDRVHPARPHQQRIGRVRRALVAVAAALDDEAQRVLAREVHRRGDVGRVARRDGVDARRRLPGVDPAEGLRQGDVVAEEVRVLGRLEELRAGGAGRRGDALGERRAHLDEGAADLVGELLPFLGRGPGGVAGAHARGRRGGDRAAAEAEEREARRCEAKRARELEKSSSAAAMARRFGHLDESMAEPFKVKRCAGRLA